MSNWIHRRIKRITTTDHENDCEYSKKGVGIVFKEPLHCPLAETANQSLETAKALYTNTHTVTNRHACYWHYKQ